jgi:hypothetical protein
MGFLSTLTTAGPYIFLLGCFVLFSESANRRAVLLIQAWRNHTKK